jgi:predicted transcriptional regulator
MTWVNKDKRREYHREYYRNHAKEINKRRMELLRSDPEKMEHYKERQRSYYIQKMGGESVSMKKRRIGKITQELFDQVKELQKQNITRIEMSKIVGLGETALRYLLKSNTLEEAIALRHTDEEKYSKLRGAQEPGLTSPITQEDFDQIKQLAFTGEPVLEIAVKMGRSEATVRRAIQADNLPQMRDLQAQKQRVWLQSKKLGLRTSEYQITVPRLDLSGHIQLWRTELDQILLDFITKKVGEETEAIRRENAMLKEKIETMEKERFQILLQESLRKKSLTEKG